MDWPFLGPSWWKEGVRWERVCKAVPVPTAPTLTSAPLQAAPRPDAGDV